MVSKAFLQAFVMCVYVQLAQNNHILKKNWKSYGPTDFWGEELIQREGVLGSYDFWAKLHICFVDNKNRQFYGKAGLDRKYY